LDAKEIGTISEQFKTIEDQIVQKNNEFEEIFEQLLSF
jgi:hypothetical protein